MNKLIIAGNGFDLAHGLPTSYNHFMDAFWRDLKENQDDDLVNKVVSLDKKNKDFLETHTFKNYKDFIQKKNKYKPKHNTFSTYNFEFRNQFFKELYEKSIKGWVDLENDYYNKLKKIIRKKQIAGGPRVTKETKRAELLKLNKEFEQVKQLLERYLQKNVVETFDLHNTNHEERFHEAFQHFSRLKKNNKIAKEFSDVNDFHQVNEVVMGSTEFLERSLIVTYVLNFNYTNTFEKYISLMGERKIILHINHIHGELNKNVVFGFGDEMDNDYKLIEDIDDNEYLRYFKSFQYVQNSNYKDLLRYIGSEKFQVIIMGHSCGLSDRTLLNTIFEHKNCRSIKVYYYQNGEYDNYTEIIQNISRHFNDKKLMRTKIVEKTLCEPMPQIQLPKKKSSSNKTN